jgi:glycosyltransferase involved in cell wall biosynthesis/SAM-dependent methyltransferase
MRPHAATRADTPSALPQCQRFTLARATNHETMCHSFALVICTVVTRSELAYVRVQATRLRQLDPAARLTALVIDARGPLPQTPGVDVVELRAVASNPELELLAYSFEDLRRRIAPALVRYCLDTTAARAVVLLDRQVDVHAPLDDLFQLATQHGVVLVPRLLDRLPDDGASPTEPAVIAGGLFESGLLGVGRSETGRRFVEWWQAGATEPTVPSPTQLDAAPEHFPEVAVLRNPGHGVAYWNLATRPLTRDSDGIRVAGLPLRTFYFDGFDPERPHWLSDENTRVRVTENEALLALCSDFADRLLAAGWGRDAAQRYAYEELCNGIPLDSHMRAVLRSARAQELELGDPLEPEGAEAVLRWANGPSSHGAPSGITRYLYELYLSRDDLQAWLPDLDGEDGAHFMEWARIHGVVEERIDPRLLAPAPTDATSKPQIGVNVAGYLSGGLGLGEAARAYITALQAADVAIHTESVEPPLPPDQTVFGVRTARKRLEFGELDAEQDFGLNLVCVNPPELPGFAHRVGHEFFAGRRTIAVWAWETSCVPSEWDEAFESVDEIWTYTTFVANVLAQRSPVPVVTVPLPVTAPTKFAPRLDVELPSGFLFLFAFDFFSTIQRKNPIGLVEAFKRAFAPNEGPQLILKSFNGDYKPEHLERLRYATRGRDDITVIDRFLSVEERNALMARADCYVSLHRSEGFGLTIAEAMSLGKPVIATAYSGNLDFMDSSCSYLVDYELTEVGDAVEIYPAEGIWAEPDVDHAAALMRHVVDDPDDAAAKAQRGRARVERQLSPAACGVLARGRLERLLAEASAEPRTRRLALDAAVAQAAYDPAVAARGRHPKATARRVALKAMRPFTHHQSELNNRTVEALRELHSRYDEVEARALRAESRAQQLLNRLEALEEMLGSAQQLFEQPVVDALGRIVEGARARPAAGHPLLTAPQGDGSLSLAFGDWNRAPGCGYTAFEDIFRGTEDEIRGRLRGYVPLLQDHAPVLDVGCGRGELLDLLRDAGIEGRGVDLDLGMVERCRQKGLNVELGDAVATLDALPERSLGAVVAIQLLEHLPYDTLMAFLGLARLKLVEGGPMIAETVNPHSPPALKAFWTDPTHQHPLLPETLLALCRLVGFDSGRVNFPAGSGRLENDVYECRDYFILARA